MPRQSPIPNFHFLAEWGGHRVGFTRIYGLAMSNIPMALRDSASRDFHPIQTPTQTEYEHFYLERPLYAGDNDFFDWWKQTALFLEGGAAGSAFRRDMHISLLNDKHEPLFTWHIRSAYPVRLSYSDMDANGIKPLTETLEIACDEITVQAVQ